MSARQRESYLELLKARKNYKEANQAYAQQDYKRASELYELTIQADPDNPDTSRIRSPLCPFIGMFDPSCVSDAVSPWRNPPSGPIR